MSTVSTRATLGLTRRTGSTASPTPPLSQSPTLRTTGSARTSSTSNAPTPRRRPPSKVNPVAPANGETQETLSASLRQETVQKELLIVQLQDKEQTISSITAENDNLSSALTAAENRVNELYVDQSRWEAEMAQRIDISEKLRDQVRELEKERRDLQRRYNEQTATFEAERQAFYDNEQHLKSRIQSLTQTRKKPESAEPSLSMEAFATLNDTEADDEAESQRDSDAPSKQDFADPDNEPAEMTALKLELSTLSTSYDSLQSTLMLLQSQLVDLKRVNQELQEENESYMILLREKTLSGQFDLMRQVGGGSGSSDEEDGDDHEGNADIGSLHSIGRSTLDRVEEEEPEGLTNHLPQDPAFLDQDLPSSSRSSRHPSRQGRKRTTSAPTARGESLADLPITGPGLDLAAELGRAENKDIVDGNTIDDHDRGVVEAGKAKKVPNVRTVSNSDPGDYNTLNTDVDALRSEVKSLKDANKALSLYASKIIDRIIAQEGFEHVLAVDYEKEPATPSTAGPRSTVSRPLPQPSPAKPRPQSVFIGRSSSNPNPTTNAKVLSPPSIKPPNPKRRSLSFDWKTFSFATEKKIEPNLRPLTLKPGSSPVVTGARKLDTYEDEEDKRERERLNATMKLMGIQPTPSIHSANATRVQETRSHSPSTANNRRFSIFGHRSSGDNSDAISNHSSLLLDASSNSGVGLGFTGGLTHEALEHAEAENSLAVLDAHERSLSQEIAKGASGGFTEIAPRSLGRRSRRSIGGSGSGSTVWSAGMSGAGEDE